ncbi:hypothetical protein ACO1PF_00490 [Alkalibacterium sp. f15]|uniref:hypothetical protein n=1 Tax=Alkalibacterium sp. f15 TaxID=3414029 RepID=UPI003BF87861
MSLPNTSFTETSHERFIIDSAVLLKNVSWNATAEEWEFEELGATEGSVSINVEMTYRQMDVNGASHVAVKEYEVLEEFLATAVASVKEMSAKIIQQALNGKLEDATAEEAPAGYSKVTPQRFLNDNSFLENIAFVGRLKSHNNEQVIAILDSPKVEGGLSGDTEDNGEMAIEQTYKAHATVAKLKADINYLPFRMYLPQSLVDGTPEQMEVGA